MLPIHWDESTLLFPEIIVMYLLGKKGEEALFRRFLPPLRTPWLLDAR